MVYEPESVWEFATSANVTFGVGASEELDDVVAEYDATSVLVVTDEGVVDAGIAEAVTPDATTESVIATMLDHSAGIVGRGIDIALGFAESSDSIDELVDTLYERFLDWRWPAVQWDREKYYAGELFSASPLETLPTAVAILSICDGEVNRAIVEGVNYGRDSDAIGTVTGSLAGALCGASVIRSGWKQQCEDRNRDFFEELEDDPDANFERMADRLVAALESELRETTARVDRLESLLEDT